MTKGRFQLARCGMHGVQAMAADSAHAFGRHTHEQYGIGVILRGAQKSLSGRGIVEAHTGDIVSVNPGEVHDGTPLGENGRAWRMLYFDPASLTDAIGDLTQGASDKVELSHPALRDPVGATHFLALFRAVTDPQGEHTELDAAQHLLLLLARLIDGARGMRRPGAPRGIERARERIDDDPSAPLSLSELAAIGGVSQFQLVRGFSKSTGLTPHAYLVQRRLQAARKQIVAGLSLADAAQGAGFADQSHLTRTFVRAYGLSPGVYASAMGQGHAE